MLDSELEQHQKKNLKQQELPENQAQELSVEKSTIVITHNTSKYLLMHYRHLLVDLNRRYDRVVCVTPKDGHEQGFAKLSIEHRPISMRQHGMNPLTELWLVIQLLKIYRELKPSKVLNFSIKPCLYGGAAARLAKVPKAGYMVTGLGYIFLTETPKAALIRRMAVKWYTKILRSNDEVFFQNKDDEKLFSDLGITRLANVHILPGTGVDLNEFKSIESIPDISRDKPIKFLFIGRMLRDKGLYELVEACKILKEKKWNFECDLLGPLDSNPSAIKRKEIDAWQKQGFIRYLGETHDVRPYIEKSHVFVLPSYREGLPRAGLEVMAMGRPVIATDVPGCREIVRNGKNGVLVPVKHPMHLAKAMKSFIADESKVSEMGEQSHQICEEFFTVEKVSAIVRSAMDH